MIIVIGGELINFDKVTRIAGDSDRVIIYFENSEKVFYDYSVDDLQEEIMWKAEKMIICRHNA